MVKARVFINADFENGPEDLCDFPVSGVIDEETLKLATAKLQERLQLLHQDITVTYQVLENV